MLRATTLRALHEVQPNARHLGIRRLAIYIRIQTFEDREALRGCNLGSCVTFDLYGKRCHAINPLAGRGRAPVPFDGDSTASAAQYFNLTNVTGSERFHDSRLRRQGESAKTHRSVIGTACSTLGRVTTFMW